MDEPVKWRPRHQWIIPALAMLLYGQVAVWIGPVDALPQLVVGGVGGVILVYGDHPQGLLGWLKSFRRGA